MQEISQLACSCAHCAQVIEYAPEAVGTIAECPACRQKSQLPPAAKSPPPVPASQAGSKGNAASGKPQVAGGHRHVFVWLAAVLFGGAVVFLTATKRSPIMAHAAEAQPPPAALPQPKVSSPKSLNDLKIGSFTLQQKGAGDARTD